MQAFFPSWFGGCVWSTARGLGLASSFLLAAAWLLPGCAAETGAKAGTECFSAIECAAGLACVPEGNKRICSSDISALETMEDAGLDAAPQVDSPIPDAVFTGMGTADGASVTDADAVEDVASAHSAG